MVGRQGLEQFLGIVKHAPRNVPDGQHPRGHGGEALVELGETVARLGEVAETLGL